MVKYMGVSYLISESEYFDTDYQPLANAPMAS